MIDSELDGDYLTIYIDTVTMEKLRSVGSYGLSAALGSILGSVVAPGWGSIGGAIAGVILSLLADDLVGQLYDFLFDEKAQKNGIWLKLKVRGHFTVPFFNYDYYYKVYPQFEGYGAQ